MCKECVADKTCFHYGTDGDPCAEVIRLRSAHATLQSDVERLTSLGVVMASTSKTGKELQRLRLIEAAAKAWWTKSGSAPESREAASIISGLGPDGKAVKP